MRRRGAVRPTTPAMVLTDGALLLFSLCATAFSAVSAYRFRVEERAVWLGALVLALAVTALMSLPKYKLPLTAAALCGWGWGVWRLREALYLGGVRLWCDMVNTFARKVPGVTAIEPIAHLEPAQWRELATLWLLMAGAVFALALGIFLCRLRCALPVILLTLLPILPALCVTEAPAPLPMAGLLAVWLTLLLTSQVERRDPAGAARLRPAALLCGVLAVAVLLRALPTQGRSQPQWASDAREEVLDAAGRLDLSELLSRFDVSGSGSTQYVSLTGNGQGYTGRTALKVQTSAVGKHYLRGWSADVYTGARWEPLGAGEQARLRELMADGLQPLMLLDSAIDVYTIVTSEGRELETMTVENVSAPGGCVYYPYSLAYVPDGAAMEDGSHLSRVGRQWEHTLRFDPQWEQNIRSSVALGSLLLRRLSKDEQAGERERRYREFVYDNYLSVPDGAAEPLADWLGQNGGEFWDSWSLEEYIHYYKWFYGTYRTGEDSSDKTRDEVAELPITQAERESIQPQYALMMATVVAGLLSAAAEYDKTAPAPPKGEDYVNWFLTESHRGYCMHFATAGALLLRLLDIPARYVSGYVVDVPRSGSAVVPDTAAHAWVEVYLDGLGWYPVEMTPGFSGDGTGEVAAEEFDPEPASTATPGAAASHGPVDVDEEDEEPSEEPSASPTAPGRLPGQSGGEGGEPPSRHWAGWTLVLLAGAALLRGLAILRRRKRLEEEPNAAVLWAYAYHRKLLPWGGGESEELTALANKARFSQHRLLREERQRALALLGEEARRVERSLPRWKRLLFRLWWGRTEE